MNRALNTCADLCDYRYGFQGQEKDDEIKGAGNSVNYKYRMHDPRLGRFFAVDPLYRKYPQLSTYQFAGNKPIWSREVEGLESSVDAIYTTIRTPSGEMKEARGISDPIFYKGTTSPGNRADNGESVNIPVRNGSVQSFTSVTNNTIYSASYALRGDQIKFNGYRNSKGELFTDFKVTPPKRREFIVTISKIEVRKSGDIILHATVSGDKHALWNDTKFTINTGKADVNLSDFSVGVDVNYYSANITGSLYYDGLDQDLRSHLTGIDVKFNTFSVGIGKFLSGGIESVVGYKGNIKVFDGIAGKGSAGVGFGLPFNVSQNSAKDQDANFTTVPSRSDSVGVGLIKD